jgi:hypothetical protein
MALPRPSLTQTLMTLAPSHEADLAPTNRARLADVPPAELG